MTKRRSLGRAGPSLSQITYGTMRLANTPDAERPLNLLMRLHDAGIDTHHSSFEYDSYPLYCETLDQLRRTGRSIQHIVKLAEPSFDHTSFDAARLCSAIDARLRELGTDHLAVVQWMCRTPDPLDDHLSDRIAHHQRAEITECFESLEADGKVGAFAVFPYITSFGVTAKRELGVRAVCSYLSLFEQKSQSLLQAWRPFIALRPFAGADSTVDSAPEVAAIEPRPEHRYEAALRYPLLHPAVATTVVSVNTEPHVDLAIRVGQTATADLAAFNNISDRVAGRVREPIAQMKLSRA